jgi:uridylate kinase
MKKEKKSVVMSLGGSIINPGAINTAFLKSFKEMIENFALQGNTVIIVCGGGYPARQYQQAASEFDVSDENKDWIGIAATKINASLVKSIFGENAYEDIITNPTKKIKTAKRILVASGWEPGFSSDMDAIILAKQFKAEKILNISNIDYVYDKDPKKFPDAKRMEKIMWDDYIKMIGTKWIPGMNSPFDPIASQEARKNKMKVMILNSNVENIRKCILDENFTGTRIE